MKLSRLVSYVIISAIPIHSAYAQWALPDVTGMNLPNDFDDAVLNMTNWILGFVSSLAVLAIIWGGIKYTYSAGDQNTATEAKRVIKYALMGLVISGIAYALVVVFVNTILA